MAENEEVVDQEGEITQPDLDQSEKPEIDYQLKFKEAQDLYVRTHADFENAKKRLEKDKAMALEYAYEKIASDLLPVIDALHAALQSAQKEEEGREAQPISQGLELTLHKMHEVLAKHGIECVECVAEFDPSVHNAVMHVSAEHKQEGEIVEVFQKGYKYKERLLRPAMVSIAKNN
ncbi:nucleotide exchange factor GrpE [Helicobacter bizzozeronii]|uniref:Protein GrpE n=1 Tax=Helicobacter bizzozeronii (strain CIII-1) TaxID=1002804 RepID=F8KTN4_HELBC|nr:nucleotide exchange factor GrpE [Helicobacter bizzozeronii]CCB80204.1 heat shock protein GrpE [Helicobacter bizzozeronii CIII-1]